MQEQGQDEPALATGAEGERFRTPFPDSFFERLAALGAGRPGQRLVELGAGEEGLARQFARQGCRVTVVDRDRIAHARRLAAAENVVIDFREADVADSGLEAGAFDVVFSGAAWRGFDRSGVMGEARRLLAAEGLFVVCALDPEPLRDVIACTGDELIMKYRLGWQPAQPDGAVPAWITHEFELAAMFGYRERLVFSRERWSARVRARGAIDELGDADARRFETEHQELLDVLLAGGDEATVLHGIGAHLMRVREVSE